MARVVAATTLPAPPLRHSAAPVRFWTHGDDERAVHIGLGTCRRYGSVREADCCAITSDLVSQLCAQLMEDGTIGSDASSDRGSILLVVYRQLIVQESLRE